jgi:hypothetical protein
MFKRRRFKQSTTFEHCLAAEALHLRNEAATMPPGIERERLIRKARHGETASHLTEWLKSPGLRPPE